VRLSPNFTVEEFIKSDTAERKSLDNSIRDHNIFDNAVNLAENILQPVRDKFGATFIRSGYRSIELNKLIGGASTSQHTLGQAADIEVSSASNYELACWIRDNLEFDQLILEFYTQGKPSSGWVHVSYRADGKNRNGCLTASKTISGTKYIVSLVP